MMYARRVPGRIAGWVCLLATLLHALAFVVHTGRAVAAPSSAISAALAGALCASGEGMQAHPLPDGSGETQPALASGCPVCTAGVSILALPAPCGFEIADQTVQAAPTRPAGRSGFEPAADKEATPIRGPPPVCAIA